MAEEPPANSAARPTVNDNNSFGNVDQQACCCDTNSGQPPAKRFRINNKTLVTQSSDPYLSEYNDRYIPKPLDLNLFRAARGIDFAVAASGAGPTADKNKDNFRIAVDDNFYDRTLYSDEYKAKSLKDVEKPHYCGPVKTTWERPQDAISGNTTYRTAYTPKCGDRFPPCLPQRVDDVILPSGANCRTLPEYLQSGAKNSYRQFKSNELVDIRPQPVRPKDNNVVLPRPSQVKLVSFPKTTTFSDAFKAYADTRPPDRIKPPLFSSLQEQQQEQLLRDSEKSSTGAKQNNISTYTDHYVWKAGQPPTRGRCAVATGRAGFGGGGRNAQQETLATATTTAAVGEKPLTVTKSTAAIECCSTTNKPKMYCTTTYDTNYAPPALARGCTGRRSTNFAPSKTPHIGVLWRTGEFGCQSTYQDNYRAMALETRALMRPPAKHVRDAVWTAPAISESPAACNGGGCGTDIGTEAAAAAAAGDNPMRSSKNAFATRDGFSTTYNTEYIPRQKTQSLLNMHKQVKGRFKPVFKPDLLYERNLNSSVSTGCDAVKSAMKADYRPFAASEIERGKVIIPQCEYKMDNKDFHDATTYGDDYVYRNGSPGKPCKPNRANENVVVVRQPNRVNSYSTLYKDTICRTADKSRGMPSDLLRFPNTTIKDNGNLIWHRVADCGEGKSWRREKPSSATKICPKTGGPCVNQPRPSSQPASACLA